MTNSDGLRETQLRLAALEEGWDAAERGLVLLPQHLTRFQDDDLYYAYVEGYQGATDAIPC